MLARSLLSVLRFSSKKLNFNERQKLDDYIKNNVLEYAIAEVDEKKIDEINILKASIMAMHLALDKLRNRPEHILVDGNKFYPYNFTPHQCIIKGDSKFLSIAAASILAKNYRDNLMQKLHLKHPKYGWNTNMGYATKTHREALNNLGHTEFHRKTFRLEYLD